MKLRRVETKGLNQLAVVAPVLRALGVAGEVNRCCGGSPTNHSKISTGKVIEALVANRLTSPTPTYRAEERAGDPAVEEALGTPPDLLNDDRIARALDAVEPHTRSIGAAVAVNATTRFRAETRLVHRDTTTFFLQGEYEESDAVGFGYSRDHRPDRKQVAVGLDVTPDGAPLAHGVYPGNTPDQKTVEENTRALPVVWNFR